MIQIPWHFKLTNFIYKQHALCIFDEDPSGICSNVGPDIDKISVHHSQNNHKTSWKQLLSKVSSTVEFARTWGRMKANRSEEMNYEKVSEKYFYLKNMNYEKVSKKYFYSKIWTTRRFLKNILINKIKTLRRSQGRCRRSLYCISLRSGMWNIDD